MLIAGAGPAGCALAIMLARAGWHVVLCERGRRAAVKVGECLPPNARACLETLGLTAALNQPHLARRTPGVCQWWGASVGVERDFVSTTGSEGWHIDRFAFEELLLQTALTAGAEFRLGASVAGAQRERSGAWVAFYGGNTSGAGETFDYLVDATGRSARLARSLGATIQYAERLVALHTVVEAGCAQKDDRLWLEAAPSGWAYSAPLPGKRLAVGFITAAEAIPSSRAATINERAASLLIETPHTLSRLSSTWREAAWHARTAGNAVLSTPCGAGWLAVGDAAAAFDPLTSYGLTFAMGSALYAAEALQADAESGEHSNLSGYAATIQKASLAARTGLRAIYGQENRWHGSRFWKIYQEPPKTNPNEPIAEKWVTQ